MDPIDVTALPDDIYAGPLHEVQRAAGATFYEDLGMLWTRSFGDPDAEYWAVRRDVGLWDVSSLVKWRLTGADALAAVDRLTSRRMRAAPAGSIRYAMVLDERGRLLDEGTICVVSSEEVYFFGNDARAPFEQHLRLHVTDLDVGIEDVTRAIPNLAVQGPRALEVLSRLTDTDLGSLRYFSLVPDPVAIAGIPGLVTRTGFTGEIGYEFFLTGGPTGAEAVWNAIAAEGATPIGLDGIEKLRIEMGLVIADEDYFAGETDPYDLSMDAFIDLEDHDFIGRDACIERAAAPARRFKTLAFEAEVDPPAQFATVTLDGVPMGEVRSADVSPRFGTLALAILEQPAAHDGTRVEVGGHAATVRPLPFDAQGRARSDPRTPARIAD